VWAGSGTGTSAVHARLRTLWRVLSDPRLPRFAGSVRRRVPCCVIVVVLIALALSPLEFSYGEALSGRGGGSVSVRTVEWFRDHGGSGIVDIVENWYYALQKPQAAAPDPSQLPRLTSSTGSAAPLQGPAPLPHRVDGALPGEGVWVPVGGDRPAAAPAYTAYFRPDPSAPSVVAGVAWMDQGAARTTLVTGTVDSGGAATEQAAGQVPPSQRADLLATFNSGFRLKDAHGGMVADGRVVRPLRDGAASLVVGRDGRAVVGQWGRDVALTPDVRSVRQNLDLVVDGAAPVAGLDADANGRWGSSHNQLQYTWRSGLGVDAAGNLLYVTARPDHAGRSGTRDDRLRCRPRHGARHPPPAGRLSLLRTR
jgi:hypothetical protein